MAASRRLGVTRAMLRRFIESERIDTKAVYQGVHFESVTLDARDLGNVEGLIREEGLNPEDWIISRVRLNRYGDEEQRRVDLEPRKDLLLPARSDGWKRPVGGKHSKVTDGLVLFIGDHHAPHHDPVLHRLVICWLRTNRPEQIVVLGDLMDYAQVSRHRKSGVEPSMQETIDAGYEILRGYVDASPGSRIRLLAGNHEDRLFNSLSDRGFLSIAGLKQAEATLPVLSMSHLLRLDELGIEEVFPPVGCSYEHAEVPVFGFGVDDLYAQHGLIASRGSGSSALKSVERHMRSIVMGHTHRQSLVRRTFWGPQGSYTFTACEAGTAALVDKTGLSYAGQPDWQQGFAVGQRVNDRWTLDLATFDNQRLVWRGSEYCV